MYPFSEFSFLPTFSRYSPYFSIRINNQKRQPVMCYLLSNLSVLLEMCILLFHLFQLYLPRIFFMWYYYFFIYLGWSSEFHLLSDLLYCNIILLTFSSFFHFSFSLIVLKIKKIKKNHSNANIYSHLIPHFLIPSLPFFHYFNYNIHPAL